MEILNIEATKYTPEIHLDHHKGHLSFIGKSYPENTFYFYSPVITWVEEYFSTVQKMTTKVDMDIIYFNSSSSKLFFDFFDILEEAHLAGHAIEVNWHYDAENESAEEAGEDFKEDFEHLSFNIVQK